MSKNKPKVCPLLSIAEELDSCNCMGDRCAWFHMAYREDEDSYNGACVLLRIADRLYTAKRRPERRGD